MKKLTFFILALSLTIFFSCNDTTNTTENETTETTTEDNVDHSTSKEVEDILSSIPSPGEITATIKASGANYTGMVLNSPNNAENYSTNYRKAINLGIYGTDLGYIGIYDQKNIINEHLKVINQLASEIDLAHLLRTKEVKRITDGEMRPDSVLGFSSDVFEDMCQYLQSSERHDISVLVLLGGWLEAIHIATTVAYNGKMDNPNLNAKIAEQKVILNKFILAIKKYENDPFFKELLVDLTNLKKLYNEVEFNESNLADSLPKDTSVVMIPTSKANITEVQLAQISIQIDKIRKAIVNPS